MAGSLNCLFMQKNICRILKLESVLSLAARVKNSYAGHIRTSFKLHGRNYFSVDGVLFLNQYRHVQIQKFHLQQLSSNVLQEREELENKYESVRNKVIFNSHLDMSGNGLNRIILDKKLGKLRLRQINKRSHMANIPVSLKYLQNTKIKGNSEEVETRSENEIVHLPYSVGAELCENDSNIETPEINHLEMIRQSELNKKNIYNWMSDYENFGEEDESVSAKPWQLNYGTPNRNVPVSKVPCGGCGALLHCRDTAIPGYLPSELFEYQDAASLRTVVCQRCHFLRFYNTVLNVIVSPEDYSKTMAHLKEKRALIVLMVDILDFPCSVWPGIMDVVGPKQPVVVVGNKADLLPPDSRGYLHRMQKCLVKNLEHCGIPARNIKHVSLISAKTGYGIEELITKLYSMGEYKGDVYLLGCTNVGKSTLFNTLLQSDYCKVKAVDLVQRATTSPWPGTTINLLKFPILRPSGWHLAIRTKRIISQRQQVEAERRLHHNEMKENKTHVLPALIGHIGMTFYSKNPVQDLDLFSVDRHFSRDPIPLSGLNPADEDFSRSKWCYDTPGVVHPDQMIHLLTTEELMMTLPKTLILPRSFRMKPNMSLFIAGLGRLDYVAGDDSLKMTVFSSNSLPITICWTEDADELYKMLLGSRLLGVPCGGSARLAKWPALQVHQQTLELQGIGWKESCGDVLLSSAGWIAITIGEGKSCRFQGWTPGGRGVYVRQPALLPFAANMCGPRIRRSPAYKKGKEVFLKHV